MGLRVPVIVILIAGSLLLLSILANIDPVDKPEESVLELTSGLPLVVDSQGPSTNPNYLSVAIPDAQGAPLLKLTVINGGIKPTVRIDINGASAPIYTVPGSIVVLGDIAQSSFDVKVKDGATESFAARVLRDGAAPAVDAWFNNTSGKPSYHLEAPLRYKSSTPGGIDIITVVTPTTGEEQARIAKTTDGYKLTSGTTSQDIQANQVSVHESSNGIITFTFRDATGMTVETVTVDRSTEPATVRLSGAAEQVVTGPISFTGPVADPDRISATVEGQEVFTYAASGGRSTLDIGGFRVLSDATLTRIDGDITTGTFTLVLRDIDGNEHKFPVERQTLEANAPATPLVTLLSPLGAASGMPNAALLRIMDVGEVPNILGPDKLAGEHYLRKSGTTMVFLQTEDEAPAFERIYLVAASGPSASAEAAFAEFQSTADSKAWRADFSHAALGTLADGDLVSITIHYEKRLAPFAVQRFTEANTYAYRVDGTPPTVTLTAPNTASDFKVPLSWSGNDAKTGIRGYEVQFREAGASTWQPWILSAAEMNGIFSGQWDTTYQFRARSLDGVGNPSEWATATTVIGAQPAGLDDINDPPTVRLLSPRSGERLVGLVSIRWEAADPDGTPVTSTVQISPDGGITWRNLFAGQGQVASWDTRLEPDGSAYRIRITASDGALSNVDVGSGYTIANVASGSAAPGTSAGGASSSGGTSGSANDGGLTPPPGDKTTDAQAGADGAAALLSGNGMMFALIGAVVLVGAVTVGVYSWRRSR